MKKKYFLTILLIVSFKKSVFALSDTSVDFENYSIGSFENKKPYFDEYQNNTAKTDDNLSSYENNNFKTNSYYKPSYQDIYNNQNNKNLVIPNKKPLYNFSDGLGEGYRVYDNSNRQSYFCGLTTNKKNIFTHQNNYNGVYVGIGANFVNTTIDITQTPKGIPSSTVTQSNQKPISSNINYTASDNSTVPSVIIGQGRLFSNDLYLGQEMSILVGDINLKKNNIKPQSSSQEAEAILKQINFRSSNLSFYTGKFGFNIFDIFLPYIKLGISLSSTNFQAKFDDNTIKNVNGIWPFIVYGAGIDVSIVENFRLMLDFTAFSIKSEIDFSKYSNVNQNGNQAVEKSYIIPLNLTASLLRANLVYRF